jgi:hypothetical protein
MTLSVGRMARQGSTISPGTSNIEWTIHDEYEETLLVGTFDSQGTRMPDSDNLDDDLLLTDSDCLSWVDDSILLE